MTLSFVGIWSSATWWRCAGSTTWIAEAEAVRVRNENSQYLAEAIRSGGGEIRFPYTFDYRQDRHVQFGTRDGGDGGPDGGGTFIVYIANDGDDGLDADGNAPG